MTQLTRLRQAKQQAGLWLVVLLTALLLAGCSSSPHSRLPPGGIVLWQQHKVMIPANLKSGIDASFKQLQRASNSTVPLVIVADPIPNAFAVVDAEYKPGVRLNAGLIDLIGYDRAAMAFVLAHEIGHIELDHLSRNARFSRQRQDSFVDLLGTVADIILPLSSLLVLAGNEAVKAGYSRDQERDADRYGLTLMVRAGFDPQGAVRFQRQILQYSAFSSLDIMASHPNTEERILSLQRQIEQSAAVSECDSCGYTETQSPPFGE